MPENPVVPSLIKHAAAATIAQGRLRAAMKEVSEQIQAGSTPEESKPQGT